MSIIDNAEADFRSKLNGSLQHIEVPEWGEDGEPLKVFFKPLINFKQQEKVFALTQAGKIGEAVAQTLIIRALDEEGKPLFQQHELDKMMRFVDPTVISRVVNLMAQEEAMDSDNLKKS